MGGSPKEKLAEFHKGFMELSKLIPDVTKGFVDGVSKTALADGALTHKTKELVALGMSIQSRCEYCIAIHVKKCLEAGATRQEIAEVCGVATLMGGGPSMTYAAYVFKAVDEFEKDPED